MSKVELLAPAGNYETMLGAFNAGADAVYLGGQGFGARAFADNFSEEEIISAIKYAHLHGKKIYLTVNTLLKEKEVSSFRTFFAPYAYAGLDAAIVQDLGIFNIIKNEFPWVELHASTQMTITGPEGARLLMDLGASRVVPARELSLEEIRGIHEYCLAEGKGIEIEAFVHGAMCYSYSGACLFSSMVGVRSGNRGRCAQPCRLPYKLNGQGKECYPLSLKDMCLVDRIPELIEAGIDSFKIEGRMKKPEYAAGVVSVYRKYIDRYYEELGAQNNEDFEAIVSGRKKSNIKVSCSEKDKQILSSLYLRSEIGEGYYFRHNGKEMVTLSNPAYNGSDEKVTSDIREKYLDKKEKLPVNLNAKLIAGNKAEIEAFLTDELGGAKVKVIGDEVFIAQNRPMTFDDCKKQLTKLGDTCFYAGEINIEVGDNIFMPVKALNELRRKAINLLEDEIIAGRGYEKHDISDFVADEISEEKSKKEDFSKDIKNRKIYVSVMNKDQLEVVCQNAALTGNVDRIYVDSRIFVLGNDIPEHGGCEIFMALPYVTRSEKGIPDKYDLSELIKSAGDRGIDGVLVRNLEQLSYIIKTGYKGKIVPDYGLYIWNHHAFNMQKEILKGDFFDEFSLPLELNLHEAEDMLQGIYKDLKAEGKESELPYAAMQVYGRVPMMESANCIRGTFGNCSGKRGKDLDYDTIFINDRTGRTMPVTYDCRYCLNLIWNSVPTSLFKKTDKIRSFSNRYNMALRLDFTTEKKNQCEDILKAYEALIFDDKKAVFGEASVLSSMEYTTGHFEKSAD